MRILCFSDIHATRAQPIHTRHYKDIFGEEAPDVVVITGDIFESTVTCNPHKQLANIFEDVPVICTFGNHEFFFRRVDAIKKLYEGMYNPNKYNVHYLDIVGHYEIDGVNFVGNVLWYDGSMINIPYQDMSTFADGRWADSTIRKFDWKNECEVCVQQIEENIDPTCGMNILCTHTVPHEKLNLHIDKQSPYNAYSGISDLLGRFEGRLDYAICGHTHRRVIGEYIYGIGCVNVGHDYKIFPPMYYVLEI